MEGETKGRGARRSYLEAARLSGPSGANPAKDAETRALRRMHRRDPTGSAPSQPHLHGHGARVPIQKARRKAFFCPDATAGPG
jgi:hypothetical protein